MSDESKGWPFDAWQPLLDARAKAIRSMRAAGHTYDEIVRELNLADAQHAEQIDIATAPHPSGGR